MPNIKGKLVLKVKFKRWRQLAEHLKSPHGGSQPLLIQPHEGQHSCLVFVGTMHASGTYTHNSANIYTHKASNSLINSNGAILPRVGLILPSMHALQVPKTELGPTSSVLPPLPLGFYKFSQPHLATTYRPFSRHIPLFFPVRSCTSFTRAQCLSCASALSNCLIYPQIQAYTRTCTMYASPGSHVCLTSFHLSHVQPQGLTWPAHPRFCPNLLCSYRIEVIKEVHIPRSHPKNINNINGQGSIYPRLISPIIMVPKRTA